MVKKEQNLENNQILKLLKKRCLENKIILIFDKLENDGGICKYKDKVYVILNKMYDDSGKIKVFFIEIEKAGMIELFTDIKEIFEKNNN